MNKFEICMYFIFDLTPHHGVADSIERRSPCCMLKGEIDLIGCDGEFLGESLEILKLETGSIADYKCSLSFVEVP